MQTKYQLTERDRAFIANLSDIGVFDMDRAGDLNPGLSHGSLKNSLSSLARRGHMVRISRDRYVTAIEGKPIIGNPLRMALDLHPGYLAFSSALRVYDLTEYEPFTIFVATSGNSRMFHLGQYEFRYINIGIKATGIMQKDGLWVSNLEKTLFDCFYRPDFAGGYTAISKATFDAKGVNWRRFMSYMERFASEAMRQRTGFVLSRLKQTLEVQVPAYVIQELQASARSHVRLVPSLRTTGTYHSDWMLTDNLDLDRALGWYWNG